MFRCIIATCGDYKGGMSGTRMPARARVNPHSPELPNLLGLLGPVFEYMVTLKVSGNTLVDGSFPGSPGGGQNFHQDLLEVPSSGGKKKSGSSGA